MTMARKRKAGTLRGEALTSVRRMARKVEPEPGHAFQVCRVSEQLFDAASELHGLGPHARTLLSAAALLHDVGLAAGVNAHHKHARDLILGYDLPGFTERERMMIACIARYHRKALPKPTHKVFRDLDKEEQAVVTRLAALLRIGDGFDRAHDAAVRQLSVKQDAGQVTIRAHLRHPSPTDVWGAARKTDLFESTFGVKVLIESKEE
ncbi:MAG: HD domain-containing protein [Candidatus Hydrogenedentes bacterium]|nr:HD domain-containing protein [Candidatus Hydrogenedentota bacterium]